MDLERICPPLPKKLCILYDHEKTLCPPSPSMWPWRGREGVHLPSPRNSTTVKKFYVHHQEVLQWHGFQLWHKFVGKSCKFSCRQTNKCKQSRKIARGWFTRRIGSSLHSNKQVVGQGSNWGGGKTGHTSGKTLIPRQHHGNWDHNEVLALIVYKHAKHATQNELIELRSQMIFAMQWWDKITKKL